MSSIYPFRVLSLIVSSTFLLINSGGNVSADDASTHCHYRINRKGTVDISMIFTFGRKFESPRRRFLKKNQNAPRPSEHPPVREEKMLKRLGGIKGCKYKTSS